MKRYLLCSVVLLAACQGKEKSGSHPKDAPADAPKPSEIVVPVVEPVRLPGKLEAAPWPKDTQRLAALRTPAGLQIAAAGVGWLRLYDSRLQEVEMRQTEGGPQVLEALDLDGDGVDELVAGWGVAREAKSAAARATVLRWRGTVLAEESLPLRDTTRAQVVGTALAGKDRLWLAYYISKYVVVVEGFEHSDKGWSRGESKGEHRVSGDLTALADGTPILAQMYGENADLPGGVYVLGEQEQALPSIRGARAVLALPAGALAFADGWHKEYKAKGQGLLSVARPKQGGWEIVSRVQVKGNFGYSRLRLADLLPDPGPEILASGNGRAVVVAAGGKNVFHLGDAEAVDAVAGDLDGDGRPEVLIAGPKPSIWRAQ
jgi:hypothetical protein